MVAESSFATRLPVADGFKAIGGGGRKVCRARGRARGGKAGGGTGDGGDGQGVRKGRDGG